MLADNVKLVQQKIQAALDKRKEPKITGASVTLVAVTKNHPPEVITASLALGVQNIGENKKRMSRHPTPTIRRKA